MDERTYQTIQEWDRRLSCIAQQLQGPLTEPELRAVLRDMLALSQEHQAASARLTSDLTETCTRQTATVTRLTTAVEELTAERRVLAHDAARAYEAGYNASLAYTNDFLEAHQGAWGEYLDSCESLVMDPGALNAIDPRQRDNALRLCHGCQQTLE